MGRRILNRKDLRADFEAAERRGKEETDEEEDEEEESEEEDEEEESEEEDGASDKEEDDETEEPKPKKRKPAKEPKAKTKPRTRTPKIPRMKIVWGVFNNSHQRVAVYDYPKRKEADDHAAKMKAESKTNQTYFVQPVRVPIE